MHGGRTRADQKIFTDRELAEDAAALRHESDALLRDAVRRQTANRRAIEFDAAAAWPQQSNDRPHQCRLASAVSSHEGQHFARTQLQADSAENLGRPIAGMQVRYLEHYCRPR